MSRSVSTCLLASSLVLALSGCGWFEFEEREEWRVQAEAACLARREVRESAYMSLRAPLNGPGVCGIDAPFEVTALLDGTVRLTQEATLGCPVVAATERWLAEIVQPAARLYFGAEVAEIHSGSYACRTRNHRPGAPLSEHAFGNAVDVMSFTLTDGRRVTVEDGWRGRGDERDFLREAFVGACDRFTTVLGPGSDGAHENHFHMDLARHDASGTRRYCRPQITFDSRLDDMPLAVLPATEATGSVRPPAAIGLVPLDGPPAAPRLRPGISDGSGIVGGGLW